MPHYFFDTRDGDFTNIDDEGVELISSASARTQAIVALAEMARDALPRDGDRVLSVDVFDDKHKPLLRTTIRFEITEPL